MTQEVTLASIVENVYKLVAPLEDQQRHRVMRSVSALFEDKSDSKPKDDHDGVSGSPEHVSAKPSKGPPPAVVSWMNRNGISQDHLEQVFHVADGKAAVIADMVPGSTKKEQTVNCYVLEGTRAFLETGSAKFTDADADALCARIGCRDKSNHSENRASAGNKITGSRKDGFILVAPGLLHAAKLVKEIANPKPESSK